MNNERFDFRDLIQEHANKLGDDIPAAIEKVFERVQAMSDSDNLELKLYSLFNFYLSELEEVDLKDVARQTFVDNLWNKIMDLCSLNEVEFRQYLVDVNVLETRASALNVRFMQERKELEMKQSELEQEVVNKENLLKELHKTIGERSILFDWDTYLRFVSYFLEGDYSIVDFDFVETREEMKAKSLIEEIKRSEVKINVFRIEIESKLISTIQCAKSFYEASYSLHRLIGMDTSYLSMKAFLELGVLLPIRMQRDVVKTLDNFEDYRLSQLQKNSRYMLKQSQSFVSGFGKLGMKKRFSIFFDTEGAILRKIDENQSSRLLKPVIDPTIFGKSDGDKVVRPCPELRGFYLEGYNAFTHSIERQTLDDGRVVELRRIIFHKQEGGKTVVQPVVEKRWAHSDLNAHGDSKYVLDSILPKQIYSQEEKTALQNVDLLTYSYQKIEFAKRPEISGSLSFLADISDDLSVVEEALLNPGNKTSDFVDLFKEKAKSVKEKIKLSGSSFLSNKKTLIDLRDKIANDDVFKMTYDLKCDALKLCDSILDVMDQLESGELVSILDKVISANFHSDDLDSLLIEALPIIGGACAAVFASTFFGVGLLMSSVFGVIGMEVGTIATHIVGRRSFGSDYKNLPYLLKSESVGELLTIYLYEMLGNVLAGGVFSKLEGGIGKIFTKYGAGLINLGVRGVASKLILKFVREHNEKWLTSFFSKSVDSGLAIDKGIGEDMKDTFLAMSLIMLDKDLLVQYLSSTLPVSLFHKVSDRILELDVFYDQSTLNLNYLESKFPGYQIREMKNGIFKVKMEIGSFSHFVTFRPKSMNLDLIKAIDPSAQVLYGLNVDSSGRVVFNSNANESGELSFVGYLKSLGFEVQSKPQSRSLSVKNEEGRIFEVFSI